eukprot:5169806-Pleurochrysis_carterae.AAC.1
MPLVRCTCDATHKRRRCCARVRVQLYSLTGDASHLSTARRFNGWVFTAPLAAGEDDLVRVSRAHACTHTHRLTRTRTGGRAHAQVDAHTH